ncbi:2,3-bisphosphoglycerate-independent phosphoglycerate mutase, partial [Patescibacteria group bacterium]|nr:2,3-bisphosphoglycerate-independent phosphoglycerate mutase [Patescibacteria group bacterium]
LIVIDGLGDRPIPELGDKTPLESAQTPNLDWLAKEGICGLVETFKFAKEIPRSDTAHLALFGYDPKIYYLGRGPYEAAGIGMGLEEGDVALRGNFAAVDNNLKIIDRRAGRISDTQSLVDALSGIEIEGVKFLIKKSYGHRAVLVLRGNGLSDSISDGDSHKTGERIDKILPICIGKCGVKRIKDAQFTAKILNEFLEKSHQILKNHPLNQKREKQGLLPANYLLVRGAGFLKETPSFKEKYGLRACCIAGGGLYKGIGKILGMDEIKVQGATGLPDTNLGGKVLAARENLERYDFIFVHIKAADNLAEDGNFKGKKEFIEKIDENLKPLLNLKNTLIVVTADHSTCCILKRHCKDPVPVLIFGVDSDNINKFSEKDCKGGKLGEVGQLDLLPTILSLINKKNV